jgi:hypothetical protein
MLFWALFYVQVGRCTGSYTRSYGEGWGDRCWLNAGQTEVGVFIKSPGGPDHPQQPAAQLSLRTTRNVQLASQLAGLTQLRRNRFLKLMTRRYCVTIARRAPGKTRRRRCHRRVCCNSQLYNSPAAPGAVASWLAAGALLRLGHQRASCQTGRPTRNWPESRLRGRTKRYCVMVAACRLPA